MGAQVSGHAAALDESSLLKDDPVDPVENSLVYYEALRKAGVPVEIHVYVKGGHAFGLRRTESPITAWPQLVETWLDAIGMIAR